MLNVIFSFVMCFLLMAAALVFAVDGAIIFAFAALFGSFIAMVVGLTFALFGDI